MPEAGSDRAVSQDRSPAFAPAYPDDTAIAAAAAEIEALRARVERTAAGIRVRFAEADESLAALRSALAAAEARAESWRTEFYLSNGMLIAELDRVATRAIAAARPDPAADGDAPEISVVMPVYNRAALVGTAIKSVLAQSFACWELIIVDDGSTDDLAGTVAPFLADPRIRLVRQNNGGECSARNHGLRLARGEVIAQLDSDNFWYPDFLDSAMRVFRSDPDLDMAYGAISYEWPNGDVRFHLLPFSRAALERDNLADVNVILYRRRAYERFGGYDETLTRAVEYDLMLRYTAHRPASIIPAVGARYRIVEKDRLSATQPLADNLFRIRRKWWPAAEIPPRVLVAARRFPQLSESRLAAEIACMRRFGAIVEVWAPEPGASPFPHDLTVHRSTLADAMQAAQPHLVHVHGFGFLAENRAALFAARLPVTAEGGGGPAETAALQGVLPMPTLHRAYVLAGGGENALPADERIRALAPAFDSKLFAPARAKDPRLVLRAAAAALANDLRFLIDLARLVPEHRVVVAVARSAGGEAEIEALAAYRRDTGSPAELMIDVPRREMAALFAAAPLYVHSVTPEAAGQIGAPVSIAEAMAAGAHVLTRSAPALVRLVGNAGATYAGLDETAALIRASAAWSAADWRQCRLNAIERAFTHHADELVLRPLFDDWCALARREARPLAS